MTIAKGQPWGRPGPLAAGAPALKEAVARAEAGARPIRPDAVTAPPPTTSARVDMICPNLM